MVLFHINDNYARKASVLVVSKRTNGNYNKVISMCIRKTYQIVKTYAGLRCLNKISA